MATRRKTIKTTAVLAPGDIFPLDTGEIYPGVDEGYDDVTSLNNVLSELGEGGEGDDGFITVFKEVILSGNKSEEFLVRYGVNEHVNGTLLDTLKRTYGGGKYKIRVYRPRAGGAGTQLATLKFIAIAADPIEAKPTPIATTVDMTPVTQLAATMQANFEKLMATLAANQPKQQSRAEMLEEMKLIHEIMAPPSAAAATSGSSVADMLAVLKMGVDMGAAGQGGGSDGAWASKAIEVFGKPIVEAMMAGKLTAAAPRSTPVRAALPQPVAAKPAVPGEGSQPLEEEDAMGLMLKAYIKLLSNSAATNQDVGEWADNILTMMPPGQLPEFETILRAPDWKEKLSAHSASITEHPVWFTNLRDTILAFIDEDREAAGGLTVEEAEGKVPAHETSHPSAPEKNDNAGGDT